MMSRIDRIRRAAVANQAPRTDDRPEDVPESRVVNLPVPVSARPPRGEERDSPAAFAAQLMGQDGQKRGLRAGPGHIDHARGAYAKVEWSGSKDRRARKGRNARTEV